MSAEPRGLGVVETAMRALIVVSVLAAATSAAAEPPPPPDVCAVGTPDAECEAALERSATAFESAGAIGKAIVTRQALIARAAKDPARAAPSLYHLGTDYGRIAEFALAADALERFAGISPTSSDAPQALADAVVFRVGLGDEARVASDVAQFRRAYAATKPDLAGKVEFALAAHDAERGDLAAVERELAASMITIDRGPTWLRMQAHALFGRALAARSDARAAGQYALVRELGATLRPAEDDPIELRLYAKGLSALGEAVLFDADAKRAASPRAPLARYAGAASEKDFDAWIARTVVPWITARSNAIGAVEPEYRKVLDIGPVPPPNAVVDAASRVALMWADASDELAKVAAALPKKAQRDKAIAAGAPLRAKAKPAALACVAYSVKFQFTDAASDACSAWLVKTYRDEFRPTDELLLPHAYAPKGGASNATPLADPRP